MMYVLCRDDEGFLVVLPVAEFDRACVDGTLPAETEPLYQGPAEECLTAMDALGGSKGAV